ncbi:Pimeloyl-ACP methyl ester carboxylesterase [Fontimonas thermophila]|uniref:Pimeloyl-ACP methyl ester carboxylesterase n=1 Tax=Fontimonas thermophila TaxID=1076937 RepID=A0A1I2KDE3_9GAMM|nr:alpha/beta fold hydrolase [Fontimonas thermophila]SFF64329.1 Pimeloyl-ACP methyl ester carboxylesterase [Fontimonas thermophila]
MDVTDYVHHAGVRLALYRWGIADGRPVVVLVHGYPDRASVWDGVAEALADRYDVVAYDVRGAGRSSAPRRVADYALEHLVGDLAAVIDAVRSHQMVHLVGHDWGSIQSWAALSAPALAGRIASFTSISGPDIEYARAWLRRRLASRRLRHIAGALRQLAHSWYIGAFLIPGLGALPWRLGLAAHWPWWLSRTEAVSVPPDPMRARDGRHGVKLYRANFAPRLRPPRPRRVEVPVQLIVPLRDRYVRPALFDDLADMVPRLHRREVDAGHWLPLAQPRALAAWIAEHVEANRSLQPSGSSPAGGSRAQLTTPPVCG